MPSSSSSGRRTRAVEMRGLPSRAMRAAALPAALALAMVSWGFPSPQAGGAGGSGAGLSGDASDHRFSDPARIDNPWSPLVPGTQFVLEGRSNRGHGRLPHRVVFTVTDLTKVIDGVAARVLWDRDYNAGRLLEAELALHAQDDDGNVWNFGEYPEEHEPGKPVKAPDTWLAGVAGARAGILMPATPRAGTASYLQGWAPDIEFADRARVARTGRRACVPRHCYRNVLVTDEWNPSEPREHQLKYYARGIGNIRVGAAGGREREDLVLVRVRHLGAWAMAEARRQALTLERRAYALRNDRFGVTPPARRDAP
jgi:hypothetical protein